VKRKKSSSSDAGELRQRAEKRLKGGKTQKIMGRHGTGASRITHELEVHQVELAMQKEELQRARAHSEAALERYNELYDFAPMGYLTIDHDGTIQKANFVAARLLGMERSRLVGGRLGHFISREHRSTFKAFVQRIFESAAKEVCEATLHPRTDKGPAFRVSIAYSGDVGHPTEPQQDQSHRSLAITSRNSI
jgi:PAS domain S-box-containing protein